MFVFLFFSPLACTIFNLCVGIHLRLQRVTWEHYSNIPTYKLWRLIIISEYVGWVCCFYARNFDPSPQPFFEKI